MKAKDSVLLRDPDPMRCEETRKGLAVYFDCTPVDTVEAAQAILAGRTIHALVVRERPGSPDGVSFCRGVQQGHPEIKCVLVAGEAGQDGLIDAFNENRLFRCLLEPAAPDALTRAVRDAVRRFEMDRVQNLLVERATEIDRTILTVPYWLFRFRSSLASLACTIAGSAGLCAAAGLVLLLAGAGALLLLYHLKSALGIDLFGDRHLKDFFAP